MKAILLFVSAAAWAASAAAADVAQCDAKPFTLGKPAVTQPKAVQAPKVKPQAKPRPVAHQAPKPRLLATCTDKSRKG
jgi:hypothetical protein